MPDFGRPCPLLGMELRETALERPLPLLFVRELARDTGRLGVFEEGLTQSVYFTIGPF